MKTFFSTFIFCILSLFNFAQTQSFTGKVKVTTTAGGIAPEIFANDLIITVQPGSTAQVSIHFNGRSPHQRDEAYSVLDIKGNVNGMLENNELIAKGWIDFELTDGVAVDKAKRYIVVKGKLAGQQIAGNVFVYMKEEEIRTDGFFNFTASGEPKPELLYPLGKSPKIFNKGWILGARFIIKNKNGIEIDLSKQVKWTGTAVFSPSSGSEVHPVFSAAGKNKIILTVIYENKKYQAEYTADVVNALDYARVGSMADCPADIHGCPACPHHVRGQITTGTSKVLIEGKPVACVGNGGTHQAFYDPGTNTAWAGCCGPNTFTISEGDPDVLIDGKAVAKLGSATQHCGGAGKIIALTYKTKR